MCSNDRVNKDKKKTEQGWYLNPIVNYTDCSSELVA